MDRELLVFVNERECGRLRTRSGPRERASFEYSRAWLDSTGAFAIDPELPLGGGAFHTQRPLFRAFTDPAPDRWGQTLLRRAERTRAKKDGRAPRTLTPIDFLMLVHDATRVGALRFRDPTPGSQFLTQTDRPVPPLLELPKLLAAATRVTEDRETDDDLALLLAPGTSLGGARPKASVIDPKGVLSIAKFPRRDDEWPVTRWEATLLGLARAAGTRAAESRLVDVAQRPVLVVKRFDRERATRVPFMSAMTAIGANDGDQHSYGELAQVLRTEGSRAADDLRELFRRMVFNILCSNTDDHLRNHGFLHDGAGWILAPAYDLNPMPTDVRPRVHALALDEDDATSSLDTALRVAPAFGLTVKTARATIREIREATGKWRELARKNGLKPREIDRMASAFEHDDAAAAARM
jgi:serine/threonine-protein kinase HipA